MPEHRLAGRVAPDGRLGRRAGAGRIAEARRGPPSRMSWTSTDHLPAHRVGPLARLGALIVRGRSGVSSVFPELAAGEKPCRPGLHRRWSVGDGDTPDARRGRGFIRRDVGDLVGIRHEGGRRRRGVFGQGDRRARDEGRVSGPVFERERGEPEPPRGAGRASPEWPPRGVGHEGPSLRIGPEDRVPLLDGLGPGSGRLREAARGDDRGRVGIEPEPPEAPSLADRRAGPGGRGAGGGQEPPAQARRGRPVEVAQVCWPGRIGPVGPGQGARSRGRPPVAIGEVDAVEEAVDPREEGAGRAVGEPAGVAPPVRQVREGDAGQGEAVGDGEPDQEGVAARLKAPPARSRRACAPPSSRQGDQAHPRVCTPSRRVIGTGRPVDGSRNRRAAASRPAGGVREQRLDDEQGPGRGAPGAWSSAPPIAPARRRGSSSAGRAGG